MSVHFLASDKHAQRTSLEFISELTLTENLARIYGTNAYLPSHYTYPKPLTWCILLGVKCSKEIKTFECLPKNGWIKTSNGVERFLRRFPTRIEFRG